MPLDPTVVHHLTVALRLAAMSLGRSSVTTRRQEITQHLLFVASTLLAAAELYMVRLSNLSALIRTPQPAAEPRLSPVQLRHSAAAHQVMLASAALLTQAAVVRPTYSSLCLISMGIPITLVNAATQIKGVTLGGADAGTQLTAPQVRGTDAEISAVSLATLAAPPQMAVQHVSLMTVAARSGAVACVIPGTTTRWQGRESTIS